MHELMTKRLGGSKLDAVGPRIGSTLVASIFIKLLESFDEALVPMDDDVERSAGASAR